MANTDVIRFDGREPVKLLKWKVKPGTTLRSGNILFVFHENGIEKKFKGSSFGVVQNLLAQEGIYVTPGQEVLRYETCAHTTVMKDLCAECGLDLRKSGELLSCRSRFLVDLVILIHQLID